MEHYTITEQQFAQFAELAGNIVGMTANAHKNMLNTLKAIIMQPKQQQQPQPEATGEDV